MLWQFGGRVVAHTRFGNGNRGVDWSPIEVAASRLNMSR
jgi:hypothetical protein